VLFLSPREMPRTGALMARSFRGRGSLVLHCRDRITNHIVECPFITMITNSSRCVKSGEEDGDLSSMGATC
jgi:hypothetical protein